MFVVMREVNSFVAGRYSHYVKITIFQVVLWFQTLESNRLPIKMNSSLAAQSYYLNQNRVHDMTQNESNKTKIFLFS